MLDDVVGAYGSRFFLAAGGVGIALLCLFGILWFLRNRAPSPFVRGGRNRQPRLQVLDAAAVDARRRLVLVRRDGVEHLIMIGGPTDIVIESGIVDPAKAAIAAPTAAFETLAAGEPTPAAARLEPPREQPRIISRQPAPLPIAPPPQAAPRQPEPQELHAPVVVATPDEPHRSEPVLDLESRRRQQAAAERPQPASVPARQRTEEPVFPDRAEEVEAADILDAARHRVLPQQQDRQPQVMPQPAQTVAVAAEAAPRPTDIRQAPAVASPAPAVAPASAPQPPREPGGDFQSILDEEMSHNLTAERIIPNAPAQSQRQQQPVQAQQRRDPELAPITGADSALQKEVARIFGEMSVNRDK